MAHTHQFTVGKSGNVETCTCGKFRFTAKQLAENPPIVEVSVSDRLSYLRGEIRAERISYGEISELQSLAQYIDKNDVELLQWAGVEEGA